MRAFISGRRGVAFTAPSPCISSCGSYVHGLDPNLAGPVGLLRRRGNRPAYGRLSEAPSIVSGELLLTEGEPDTHEENLIEQPE
jgi:hypothetical protein